MNETLVLAIALILGSLLGAFFFGGLWLTVRRGISIETLGETSGKNPALLFFGSLLLRMSVTLAGFYFVSGGHLDRLISCLLGFLIVRVVVSQLNGEGNHAAQS